MQQAQSRQAILPVTIKDRAALYNTFMPGIRGGGLFIPTSQNFRLGDEIFVLLHLAELNERMPVTGKVVWVTPAGAGSGSVQGVGIQFNESSDNEAARSKIETTLAAMVNSDKPTFTM